MSQETLKSEKAAWAEKKRSGSERKRRAAVSVQTARIIDKLLERSKGLSGSSYEHPNNATTVSKRFVGAREGKPEATLKDSVVNYNLGEDYDTLGISTHEHQFKPLLGKEKTVKTARITRTSKDMLDSKVGFNYFDFESEGKQRPTETHGFGRESYSHNVTSERAAHEAAPALYEIKKAIDEAEEQQSRRAA